MCRFGGRERSLPAGGSQNLRILEPPVQRGAVRHGTESAERLRHPPPEVSTKLDLKTSMHNSWKWSVSIIVREAYSYGDAL